jgi:hypothetical protein
LPSLPVPLEAGRSIHLSKSQVFSLLDEILSTASGQPEAPIDAIDRLKTRFNYIQQVGDWHPMNPQLLEESLWLRAHQYHISIGKSDMAVTIRYG